MRDARKLFRLFKTINEAKKIIDLVKQEPTVDNSLNIMVRGFFGVYWFFDNLNILSKIKILSHDPKKMAKWGSTFWLLALVTNLALLIRNLMGNTHSLKKTKKYGSMTDEEAKDRGKEIRGLLAKRRLIVLNIVKVVGDIIPAGHGS
jgi:peroxin-11B